MGSNHRIRAYQARAFTAWLQVSVPFQSGRSDSSTRHAGQAPGSRLALAWQGSNLHISRL